MPEVPARTERFADSATFGAGTVRLMAWVLWLAVPVLTPLAVACAVWLRSRPPRALEPDDAMRQHRDYLAALVTPARCTHRAEPPQWDD